MKRPLPFLLAALALPAVAGADVIELNANAGFDANINGVVVSAPAGGSAGWSATDLHGQPGSGSLVLQGPPGHYYVRLCLRPNLALPSFGRHVFEFGATLQGSAPAVVVTRGVFAFGGDDPVNDGPCDGPWTAYLQHIGQGTVMAPARLTAAIPTYAFPLLTASLDIHKADAGPLFIDDWSVSVDTDVIFRDDDPSAIEF